MEKLKMHTPNLTATNVERIRELFPNCVTEARDEKGGLRLSVDFDQLRQELSDTIVEGPQERYQLNWPGKREALITANAPIAKTLRPCREESVDFDTTQNLFIEGDNLDALKLLQETYLGKVKMIYIDPPYNTGNDFIYEDDFAEDAESFLKKSNQKDEEGKRLVANPESNGRFHSDWLSMMYPRLKLARNLLRDDGVVCISIDNNEVFNCRSMCNELYGNDNFVSAIANINNPKGRSDDKHVATAHEHILVYAKNQSELKSYGFEPGEEVLCRYNKFDTNGEKYREIDLRKTGDNDLREDRPNLFYYFHYNESSGDFYPTRESEPPKGYISIFPCRKDDKEGNWRWGVDTAKENISNLIPKLMPQRGVWGVMEKDYLCNRELVRATSAWTFKDVNSERGSEVFADLMVNRRVFGNPKPIGSISRLLKVFVKPKSDELILDYFAGSATTAHAIMQLNAEDGGNRQFIMVQLPEVCAPDTEAAKAGYSTIAEISKERIRRAGKKILDGEVAEGWKKDIGFRVLKVDSSNMADVHYTPDETQQKSLDLGVSPIKSDRTAEDLLFQVLLDWSVGLTHPITKETVLGKTVFLVNGGEDLVACFDTKITEEFIEALADRKPHPLRVVFRDDAFVSDAVKINAEQIFKQKCPGTEVKSI